MNLGGFKGNLHGEHFIEYLILITIIIAFQQSVSFNSNENKIFNLDNMYW